MKRRIMAMNAILIVTMAFAGASAAKAEPFFDRSAIKAAAERLNMTETQRNAVRPIIVDGMQERRQILMNAGFEHGTKPSLQQLMQVRDPIQASRARTEAQLGEILSPAQMQEYRQIVEERRQKLRARLQ
jgi:uncharacterized membrane protein